MTHQILQTQFDFLSSEGAADWSSFGNQDIDLGLLAVGNNEVDYYVYSGSIREFPTKKSCLRLLKKFRIPFGDCRENVVWFVRDTAVELDAASTAIFNGLVLLFPILMENSIFWS